MSYNREKFEADLRSLLVAHIGTTRVCSEIYKDITDLLDRLIQQNGLQFKAEAKCDETAVNNSTVNETINNVNYEFANAVIVEQTVGDLFERVVYVGELGIAAYQAEKAVDECDGSSVGKLTVDLDINVKGNIDKSGDS